MLLKNLSSDVARANKALPANSAHSLPLRLLGGSHAHHLNSGNQLAMLPPSNLQHTAHKTHSSARPHERVRVSAGSMVQEATILKLHILFLLLNQENIF